MSNPRRKISRELARELVEHYLIHGRKASAIKCMEAGVSAQYASSIAASLGMHRPRYRAGTKYKNQDKKIIPMTKDKNDHRWQWAIDRGSVVA